MSPRRVLLMLGGLALLAVPVALASSSHGQRIKVDPTLRQLVLQSDDTFHSAIQDMDGDGLRDFLYFGRREVGVAWKEFLTSFELNPDYSLSTACVRSSADGTILWQAEAPDRKGRLRAFGRSGQVCVHLRRGSKVGSCQSDDCFRDGLDRFLPTIGMRPENGWPEPPKLAYWSTRADDWGEADGRLLFVDSWVHPDPPHAVQLRVTPMGEDSVFLPLRLDLDDYGYQETLDAMAASWCGFWFFGCNEIDLIPIADRNGDAVQDWQLVAQYSGVNSLTLALELSGADYSILPR